MISLFRAGIHHDHPPREVILGWWERVDSYPNLESRDVLWSTSSCSHVRP